MGAMRLGGPSDHEDAMAPGHPERRAELPGRTPEPVQHAIEVEVVHPGCTARERGPDREAIERPADVRRRCARVDPCLGEERCQARRRRRAGRDGDTAIEARETPEGTAEVLAGRAPRVGLRRGETSATRSGVKTRPYPY